MDEAEWHARGESARERERVREHARPWPDERMLQLTWTWVRARARTRKRNGKRGHNKSIEAMIETRGVALRFRKTKKKQRLTNGTRPGGLAARPLISANSR